MKKSTGTKTGLETMAKFEKMIGAVRELVSPDFAISQLHLFLAVCQEDGITQTELAKRLGMPQATVSRNIIALGTSYNKKTGQLGGYGLVDSRPDLYERRRLACFLTEKGKKLSGVLAREIIEV